MIQLEFFLFNSYMLQVLYPFQFSIYTLFITFIVLCFSIKSIAYLSSLLNMFVLMFVFKSLCTTILSSDNCRLLKIQAFGNAEPRFFFFCFLEFLCNWQQPPGSPSLHKSHSLVASLSNLRSQICSTDSVQEQVPGYNAVWGVVYGFTAQ